MDDFDREFAKNARFTRRFMVVTLVATLIGFMTLVVVGYNLVLHFWG